MVRDAKEGFQKVLADEEGTFAFIHEASQVKKYALSISRTISVFYNSQGESFS